MSSGNAIRGSRVGAGPMGEAERGESAPRVWVSFWCANGHETRPSFATDAAIPETWECPRCGNPVRPPDIGTLSWFAITKTVYLSHARPNVIFATFWDTNPN